MGGRTTYPGRVTNCEPDISPKRGGGKGPRKWGRSGKIWGRNLYMFHRKRRYVSQNSIGFCILAERKTRAGEKRKKRERTEGKSVEEKLTWANEEVRNAAAKKRTRGKRSDASKKTERPTERSEEKTKNEIPSRRPSRISQERPKSEQKKREEESGQILFRESGRERASFK